MALAMRDFGIVPDVVLVSSARRTLQTLEAFAPFEQGALVEPLEALYLASWQQMLDVIRRVPETARSVMLVGHNPGLHDLAMGLADPNAPAKDAPMLRRLAEGYPTGALAEFLVATPWQLLESGTGRLVRFVVPGDLLPAELTEQPTGVTPIPRCKTAKHRPSRKAIPGRHRSHLSSHSIRTLADE